MIIRALEVPFYVYEDRLRELRLFSLEKKGIQGHFVAAFWSQIKEGGDLILGKNYYSDRCEALDPVTQSSCIFSMPGVIQG